MSILLFFLVFAGFFCRHIYVHGVTLTFLSNAAQSYTIPSGTQYGKGLFGGSGSTGAGGGGCSNNYNAADSTVAGLDFDSGSGAYDVAASAVSGSVSIIQMLLIGAQAFSYLSNVVQSYTIPSGTQYLDLVVIG